MNRVPSVSVVIPVHNQEMYVGRCLRSILNQSLNREDYEIIVVDDGSTDRSLEALHHFQGDIRLLSHGACQGLPAAINSGVREARGQFIVRLDSDDYVHTDFLKILALYLRMNSHFDAVACDYLLVDDHENILRQADCSQEPIGCGIMFRVEQLIDIGLYDENFLSREDEDLRIRFLKKHDIHRAALPLYRYRRHGNNMTNNQNRMDHFQKILDEKHGEPENE